MTVLLRSDTKVIQITQKHILLSIEWNSIRLGGLADRIGTNATTLHKTIPGGIDEWVQGIIKVVNFI